MVNRLIPASKVYNTFVFSPTDYAPETSIVGSFNYAGSIIWYINKTRFSKIRANYLILTIITAFYYYRFCKYYRPDIVHCHFSQNMSWIPVLFSRIYKNKVIITEHHTGLSNIYKSKSKKALYLLQKYALHNADRVLAVSKYLQKDLDKYYNIKAGITINPINTTEISLSNRKIDIECIHLLIGGHNNMPKDKKGFMLAISALEVISLNSGGGYVLNFFGDGNYEAFIKSKISEPTLDQIRFHGTVNRKTLNDLFQQCDIYLSLSAKETFGVVVLEAMLAGLPCIILPSGGPEAFSKSFNGELLREANPSEVSASICKIVKNYYNLDRNKIRNYVIDNYSPQQYLNIINKVYSEC